MARNGTPKNLGRGVLLRKAGSAGRARGNGPQNLGRGNWLQNYTPPATPGTSNYAPPPAAPAEPPDPAYEQWKISQGLNNALAGGEATYQRGQTGQTLGYNQAGQRDYSNPYSRAALYEESYKRDKLGTTTSMANRGQLYSGAYGTAQNENARNQSIAQDALRRQASDVYHGIDLSQAQGAINYGSGGSDEALKALLKRLGVSA